MKFSAKNLGFLLLFIFTSQVHSQTCGFGCLGLGGFYAGFSYQEYNPVGLNRIIQKYNENPAVTNKLSNFGKTSGFRVGANILRIKYKSFFITTKGYYQFLKEDKEAIEISDGKERTVTYSLKMDYWGAGINLGFSLYDFLDLKLIDSQIIFQNVTFKESHNPQPVNTADKQYNTPKTELGYSIASGLIFNIIQDYISIETTAGYVQMNIKDLEKDNGTKLENNGTDFIKSGGFNALVQINIGIPLY